MGTQNAGLTHKAKFWCNYVSALKGSQDLRAPEERMLHSIHPSIVETLPETFPDLKHEFSKLESQMFDRPKRPGLTPLTPVLPDAHDRIFTAGYSYFQSTQKSTEPTGQTQNACCKISMRISKSHQNQFFNCCLSEEEERTKKNTSCVIEYFFIP